MQSFAARLVTGKWEASSEELRSSLGWPLLVNRRAFHKLCLCENPGGGSLISPTVFVPHPSPSKRSHVNLCSELSSSFTVVLQDTLPLGHAFTDLCVSCMNNIEIIPNFAHAFATTTL